MLVHRNISYTELSMLLKYGVVNGQYNYQKFDGQYSSFTQKGTYVSFYKDDFWWVDKEHYIEITIDIDENKCEKGIGTYYTTEKCTKTGIWYGQRGDCLQEINEVYLPSYELKDIKTISFTSYCGGDFVINRYKNEIQEKAPHIQIVNNKEYDSKLGITESTMKIQYCPPQYKSYFNLLRKDYTGEIKFHGCKDYEDFWNYPIGIKWFQISNGKDTIGICGKICKDGEFIMESLRINGKEQIHTIGWDKREAYGITTIQDMLKYNREQYIRFYVKDIKEVIDNIFLYKDINYIFTEKEDDLLEK